jgi:hypothetical protein
MRRQARWVSGWLVAVAWLVGAWGVRAEAPTEPRPGDVVEREGDVVRNWTLRLFEVRGAGAPPSWTTSHAQARILAEETARANAQQKLLEAILDTRIDARSLFRNATVVNTDLEKTIKGELRYAFEKGVKEFDDGRVEVTLGLWVRGEIAHALLGPAPEPRRSPTPTPSSAPPDPAPQATVTPAAAPPPAPSLIYSGLVVDARGLGVRPAMSPRLVSEAGQEIYGSAVVDRAFAIQQGMAGYSKDLGAAQANERVASRPLTIKGLKADGPNRTDIVISNADAQLLLGAAQHLSFLEKAHVMIVVD